jgi:hydantoinase/carbamoylase family amidase
VSETASAELKEAAARVPARLEELARVGADPAGGITRLPLSAAESEAVALFVDWARAAGADVMRDRFGSVFAVLGDWETNPGLMVGSHLDTVPRGGAYDGALGVVAAVGVLDAWDERSPVCAAAFRSEEAAVSGHGRLGSAAYTGATGFERAAELLGGDPSLDLCGLEVRAIAFPRAYLELHIEQGPRLSAAGRHIGAVTGIAGYARWSAAIQGRADHVGTTPMDGRRDALAAAAALILAVERVGRDVVEVGSVGRLEHEPNAVGVVAEHARLTADLRSLDDDPVEEALARLEEAVNEICGHRGVEVETSLLDRVLALRFPQAVVEAVEAAARAAGEVPIRLPSGANHDASNLARVCPAGMIFVPSEDGRSHSRHEYTTPADCERGATVLALAVDALARNGSEVR